MKRKIIALILLLSLALTGCRKPDSGNTPDGGKPGDNLNPGENITTDDSSYGEDLEDLGAMDGYFEEERKDISVRCVEGTPGAYKLEGNIARELGGGLYRFDNIPVRDYPLIITFGDFI